MGILDKRDKNQENKDHNSNKNKKGDGSARQDEDRNSQITEALGKINYTIHDIFKGGTHHT